MFFKKKGSKEANRSLSVTDESSNSNGIGASNSSILKEAVVIHDNESGSQSTISFCFQDGVKCNAGIRWVLKYVVSDNSVADCSNLLQGMFPDSKIALMMHDDNI